MKINSNKDSLVQGVSVVVSSVSSKNTLPILQNFLMETKDKKIKLVKTDLEIAVIHHIPADIEKEGSITVNAKDFSDIINSLPDDKEISLNTDKDNKTHIKSGKTKFWIAGIKKEEYPIIPQFDKDEKIELPVNLINDMIQKTIFSASNQETRYVLNGVLWILDKNSLEMVATDGRRLALSFTKNIENKKKHKIIIPSKILMEVSRFLTSLKTTDDEKIEISISSNQIAFKIKETVFISRLIEGNFPNYNQVVPAKTDITFTTKTKELLAVTKRAALCTAERGGAVKYEMKDGWLLINSSSQKMEFSDEIKTEYSGKDFQSAFNPQYILDVLKHIKTEDVVFSLTNPVNPVVVEPSGQTDSKYVIMPVRV